MKKYKIMLDHEDVNSFCNKFTEIKNYEKNIKKRCKTIEIFIFILVGDYCGSYDTIYIKDSKRNRNKIKMLGGKEYD